MPDYQFVTLARVCIYRLWNLVLTLFEHTSAHARFHDQVQHVYILITFYRHR